MDNVTASAFGLFSTVDSSSPISQILQLSIGIRGGSTLISTGIIVLHGPTTFTFDEGRLLELDMLLRLFTKLRLIVGGIIDRHSVQ
jgi:hypothetical protein